MPVPDAFDPSATGVDPLGNWVTWTVMVLALLLAVAFGVVVLGP